jgi:hypothetical protein
MNEAFPQFSQYLKKMMLIQNLELSNKEIQNLELLPSSSLKFYNDIIKCKSNNKANNVKCLVVAIENSGCNNDYKEIITCSKYLTKKINERQPNVISFCFKEDNNLAYCLDEITDRIIENYSGLPPIIS